MPSAVLPLTVQDPRAAREPQPRSTPEPGFSAALAGAGAPRPSGSLVPVVRTSLSAGQAQEALGKAWQRVTGEVPSEQTLSLITAQWSHETGHGASMYNYNFAGIKGAGPSGLSVAQRTTEGHGASERRIVDNFRAYRTAEEGATDYVQLLNRRFPEAVQAARAGDPAGFVRGLKAKGYFTGHEGAYLSSVTSIAARLSGSPLAQAMGAPQALEYGGPPRGTAALPYDLRGLYAEMAPASPDAFVDALAITDQINRAALRAFSGNPDDAQDGARPGL